MWRSGFSGNKLFWKSCNICEKENLHFKKKSQINLAITFNWNYFPEKFPHPEKYALGNLIWILIREAVMKVVFMSCYLHKFLKLHIITRKTTASIPNSYYYYLFLEVFFCSWFSRPSKPSSRFWEWYLGCLVVGSSLIRRMENYSKWPLVVTRCHLLSVVVTRCTTHCHSLSFEVSLACLFIKRSNKRYSNSYHNFKKIIL